MQGSEPLSCTLTEEMELLQKYSLQRFCSGSICNYAMN